MNDLEKQILAAVGGYAKGDSDIQAAVLSGISLTARFLAANDGGPTPHQVEQAAKAVAAQLGFDEGRIR